MKKIFNTLIVDDERLARKDLIAMLEDFESIRVVGEAEDVSSAIQAVEQHKPDIIFLDIQMPGESGFDLLEKIKFHSNIIFVTAYDEYAIRAFEVNALDYLLKPVNPERLARAIRRIETEEPVDKKSLRPLAYNDCLFLSINNHLKFMKVKTILCINSAGDYSEVVTTDGEKGLTQKSLREWESRLPDNYFCRIHRSTIINMEFIERVEEWFNYSFRVYLKHIGTPFVISRRYAAVIKNKFN
jgi:two-component system LytT family response regulator